jgi:anti-sigma regulatory factor (Ser/Thr protein kinase)
VSTSYRATFTSDPRNATLARRSIASFACVCGFSEQEVANIRLAAGEALGNAVEHGKSLRSSGFSVRCTFDGEQLIVEVRDNGSGFSPFAYDVVVPPLERERGLGIFLMRRLMDDVSYSHNGTLVRLALKRQADVGESFTTASD